MKTTHTKPQDLLNKVVRYLKAHKPAVIAIVIIFLVAIASIPLSWLISDFIYRDQPKISQLEGMTINAAEEILQDKGVLYDFDGTIFDENAKDEQTITRITRLYNDKGSEISVKGNRRLLKGYRVTIFTEHVTKSQQEAVDACRAKGNDYFHRFSHGKVECKLTTMAQLRQEKTACEEDNNMVWYDDSVKCITKAEADERRAKESSAAHESEEAEQKRAEEERKRQEEERKKQEEEHRRQEAEAKRQDSSATKETTCFNYSRIKVTGLHHHVASKDDKQLVEIDAEISPVDSSISFHGYLLKLKTTEGTFNVGENLNNDPGLGKFHSIAAGQAVSGKLYFWIPQNATAQYLIYTPSDESCQIDLR